MLFCLSAFRSNFSYLTWKPFSEVYLQYHICKPQSCRPPPLLFAALVSLLSLYDSFSFYSRFMLTWGSVQPRYYRVSVMYGYKKEYRKSSDLVSFT